MKVLIILGSAITFLVVIFLITSFPPSVSEVISRQKSAAYKNYGSLSEAAKSHLADAFPLPNWIVALFPDQVIYSYKWHRSPSIVIAILALILLSFILKELKASLWSLWLLAVSPWFVKIALFDVAITTSLALFLLLILLHLKRLNYLLPFVILLMVFTSLAAVAFAIIFLAFLLFQKPIPDTKIMAVGIAIVILSTFVSGRGLLIKNQIFLSQDNYILARAKFDVDQRVRDETKFNNYQNIIPLPIKRIAYNKWYFEYLHISKSFFNSLNLDKLFSPTEVGVTVAKNLWGETGFISLFFWQMALVILGLVSWEQISPIFRKLIVLTLISGVISAAIYPSADFEQGGILILLGIVLLAGHGLSVLIRTKWATVLVVSVATAGLVATYDYFATQELVWRDNRPYAMHVAIASTKTFSNSHFVVSNLIGPAHFYYAWEYRLDPDYFWTNLQDNPTYNNFQFANFDLSQILLVPPGIYVGLPGQFAGSKARRDSNNFTHAELPPNMHVLSSFDFPKNVSFGNGNAIWTVQVN